MKITRAPEIEVIYDQKIQDLMTGKTEMRSVRYTQKRTRTHLSDVTSLCILQPYYHRVISAFLPPSYKSCWSFLRGRVVERSIALELAPVTVDCIIGTVDDSLDGDIVEI